MTSNLPAVFVAAGLALAAVQSDPDVDTRFERLDEDGDGALSREELSMLARARFDELDSDDDGAISVEELRELDGVRDPKATFLRLDTDDDGRISHDELPDWMRARFENIDINDDGFIDEGEVKMLSLRAREARNSPSGLMRRLMELDVDGDGRLHRDELPEAMSYLRERFDDFDVDGDDFIDGSELRAMTEEDRRLWWRFPPP